MRDAPATILNVNDDEVGRYAVSRILKTAGFHVLEAASGFDALKMAQTRPDLIILDVRLPDIIGFEVCRRLREDPVTASIAVLHLSASFVNDDDAAFGLNTGADGYLTQPVEPPVLVAHIRALLRMRKAEEAAQEKAIQWQTTFDSICDAICLLDTQGRIRQCNAAMAALLQQDGTSLYGKTFAEATLSALNFQFPPIDATDERQENEIIIGDRWFHVTTDSIRKDSRVTGSVYVMSDITARKRTEEENVRLVIETRDAAVLQREFMRDILNGVTEGKLRLCDRPGDLPEPLSSMGEELVLAKTALSELRRTVMDALEPLGFSFDRVADLTTAVSEAGMNAVVHAGGGKARVFTETETGDIQVWIEDEGGGIDVDRLPHATLQRGYTTAGTLGQGFKIMLQTVDRVWLLTDTSGTTVVISQNRSAPSMMLA